MNWQQIHMAVNKVDGDTKIFASRYIGPTNTKGSRFRYQWVNVSFEGIEPAKTVSWNYEGSNQTDQLQLALGNDWKVLTQWELHKAVQFSNLVDEAIENEKKGNI